MPIPNGSPPLAPGPPGPPGPVESSGDSSTGGSDGGRTLLTLLPKSCHRTGEYRLGRGDVAALAPAGGWPPPDGWKASTNIRVLLPPDPVSFGSDTQIETASALPASSK